MKRSYCKPEEEYYISSKILVANNAILVLCTIPRSEPEQLISITEMKVAAGEDFSTT